MELSSWESNMLQNRKIYPLVSICVLPLRSIGEVLRYIIVILNTAGSCTVGDRLTQRWLLVAGVVLKITYT